jgi:anti-sigma factor RsiW
MAPGEHLGDALSALLDGELSPDEVTAARAHLAVCASCAAELEAVDAARSVLRALPVVEAPAGFLEGLAPPLAPVIPLRRRSAVLSAVASVAASLIVLALGAGGVRSPFSPQVSGAAADHADTVAALSSAGAMTGVANVTDASTTATTAAPRPLEGLPAPFRAPLELAGDYHLVQAFGRGDTVHLVYQQGHHALSVFEAAGEVEWSSLPSDGERHDDGDVSLWEGDVGEGHVVVLEHDGLAATIVGDDDSDVLDAARSLPGPRSLSLLQQAQRTCSETLDSLSPLG